MKIGYTYRDMDKLLRNNGWSPVRRKSQHVTYSKPSNHKIITLVDKSGEMKRPLCRRLLKEAGIL